MATYYVASTHTTLALRCPKYDLTKPPPPMNYSDFLSFFAFKSAKNLVVLSW